MLKPMSRPQQQLFVWTNLAAQIHSFQLKTTFLPKNLPKTLNTDILYICATDANLIYVFLIWTKLLLRTWIKILLLKDVHWVFRFQVHQSKLSHLLHFFIHLYIIIEVWNEDWSVCLNGVNVATCTSFVNKCLSRRLLSIYCNTLYSTTVY